MGGVRCRDNDDVNFKASGKGGDSGFESDRNDVRRKEREESRRGLDLNLVGIMCSSSVCKHKHWRMICSESSTQ